MKFNIPVSVFTTEISLVDLEIYHTKNSSQVHTTCIHLRQYETINEVFNYNWDRRVMFHELLTPLQLIVGGPT